MSVAGLHVTPVCASIAANASCFEANEDPFRWASTESDVECTTNHNPACSTCPSLRSPSESSQRPSASERKYSTGMSCWPHNRKGPTLGCGAFEDSSIVSAVRLLTATLYPVNIRPLLGLRFAAIHGFSGHVAGVVMILARLLFARLLLVWILVVGHPILL